MEASSNLLRIVSVSREHELWRTVPACYDMLGHDRRSLLRHLAGETKIGDTKVAVFRDEEVSWLQITVDDSIVVRKAKAAKKLEKEVLEVLQMVKEVAGQSGFFRKGCRAEKRRAYRISQRLRRLNDAVQIRVHEFHDDVQLVVISVDTEVFEADDVGVFSQVTHESHLTQSVLSVDCGRAHWRDLLNSYFSTSITVLCSADNAIGS